MRKPLLSVLRQNTKLLNSIIFFTCWAQLHANANSIFLHKNENITPIMKVSSSVDGNTKKDVLKKDRRLSEVSDLKNTEGNRDKIQQNIAQSTTMSHRHNDLNLTRDRIRYYISDIKEGIIGKDDSYPIDQVYDNIFNILLGEKINSAYQYTLEYDLYGAENYNEISKVINDESAIGGSGFHKNEKWTHQSEPVSVKFLKEGNNTIIFTAPYLSKQIYKIRNLQISVSEKKKNFENISEIYNSVTISKFIANTSSAEKINLESAELTIPKNVLKKSQSFSITALRDIDMSALSPEMVNVTSKNAGYRFLPHGEHFSAPAKISIGYDKNKIPAGYTEQDIRTYYFNKSEKKWIALEKDSLNYLQNSLVSKTTHFTDMINGILKVPESPETGSYAPNSIKDIKAANPAEGIVSIAPPSPNSMGNVATSFPIKLPAGRAGMQPSLNVSYNSEGGNGWMGLGWDLSVPAVTIDTRWGVPRYENGKETEIYSLGGEQLTFEASTGVFAMPNRNEGFDKARLTDRQFYPRIEGAYNKIMRKGNSPKNYVWIVTSKDGTKSYFGGDETGVKDNAVLKDANGNIGYWGLYKTIDMNNNYVQYNYNTADRIYQNPGKPGNGGQEIYIKEIKYTLHTTNTPPKNYKVTFETSSREDIQINGRLGFLQVTSNRLTGLNISYDNQNIRRYDFGYKANTSKNFKKTLLETITEKDASGVEFYTNRIEYNEAPTEIFGTSKTWQAPDNPNFSGLAQQLQGGYSLLSGNYSRSKGTSFRIGVGAADITALPPNDTSILSFNKGTFGAHGGFAQGSSKTQIFSIDIDGDNLPDRVYMQDDGIYFSKNLSTAINGIQNFGTRVKVESLSNIGRSSTNTWNVGIGATFGSADIGFDYSNSTSSTKSYFMDFNDDKLVDFVKDGKVYFNRIVNGVPTFNPDSGLTPYPINITSIGAQTSTSLFDDNDKAEKTTMLKQNPLQDVVRTWVAPKTGTITVKNSFNLEQIACGPDDDCSYADGVAIAFQYKNNDPIVKNINAGDYAVYTFADQVINITKGEKLYFRITSKYDGSLDQVKWQPSITYSTPVTPAVDSDNRNLNNYISSEDFVNTTPKSAQENNLDTASSSFIVSADGTLNLFLDKPIALSDNANILVNINGTTTNIPVSHTSTYGNIAVNTSPFSISSGQKVIIKVKTDTQIDWSKFKLTPEFTETTTGKKTYLPVEYTMYNDRGNFSLYQANNSDVGKKILVKASSLPNFNNKNGRIVVSAKAKNKLLTKTIYEVINNNNTVVTTYAAPYTITSNDVAAGNNQIYLETTVTSDNRDFINSINTLNGVLVNSSLNYINAPSNLSVQLPNANNTSHSDGTIVIGQATTLYFMIGNYATDTSATLSITDTATGAGVNFPNGTLSGQPGLFTSTTATLNPGVYSYNLNFSKGSSSNAYTKIYITNGGSETNMTSFVTTPPHKPILTPQTPTSALSSNQYDDRFGSLYRGWGGFILNGNNSAKTTVVEPYDLNNNFANAGTVAEMKVDETRLSLSNAYGTSPSTNPTINYPTTDANGNVVINNNDSSLSQNYFITITSNINNIDKGRLEDVDPAIYISKNVINVSRLNLRSIDGNFNIRTLTQSPGSQLNAPEIKSKNQSVSGRAGVSYELSISASKSLFNENKSLRSLIDFNGDGFPDDFAKTKVQVSNPIGFLSPNTKNVGSEFISKADFLGVSAGYSFKHADSKATHWGILSVPGVILCAIPVEKTIEGAKIASINIDLDTYNNQSSKQAFIDINGDGLPDKFNNGTFELNTGNSLVNNTSWDINEVSTNKELGVGGGVGVSIFKGSFEGGFNLSTNTSTVQSELLDINGDGLSDNVVYSGSGATITFNKGDGFSGGLTSSISAESVVKTVSFGGNIGVTIPLPIIIPPSNLGLKITISAGDSAGESSSKTKSSFKDMNGDGYLDYVTSDDANNVQVRLNQIGTTNLLKKVTTPMGGSWEVAYERVGNTYDMPQSKYVLKSVVTNDGFTGDNTFMPDVSKVTATYENPFYSRRERAFYGFEKLTVNQIDTKQGGASSNIVYRKTIQSFNNRNYYLKGTLLNEKLLDINNKVWTEKNNTFSLRKIKNVDLTETLYTGEAEKSASNYACFLALTGIESKFYEGGAVNKSTSTLFKKFDQWGNVVEVEDKGDSDIGVSEILTSTIKYSLVNSAAYIVMPTSVKNTANGVAREKKAAYNTANGNLLKMTILNQGTDYSVYDFEYDIYGNITKSTGPANYNNQRFFHQYTYDDNVKTYPVKVQDAFGYTSKTQYDFRFGLPTLTEDMNLQPMKYVYDAKARTTEIVGPYEMFNNIPWTIKFEYNPIANAPQNATTAQSYAITKHYDPENIGNTINTITIADGFGSPIQVKKTGEIHNEGLKYIVAGKVEQDAFGRALKTYYPTVESIGASNTKYNAAVDNIEPTTNQYDILDRVIYTKLPGENLFSTVTYGFENDVQGRKMFETIFKDELGSVKKTYTDIKGRTTSVHEVSNTGDIKTQFTHDAIGQIIQVKDVQGNITSSVYDDLGRRTSYTHPDSGITTYKYDKAGNMTSKTNAANEVVTYDYDYTRLKAVNYPVYPENNVKYYYGNALDASAMDNNAVGRLWYQTDATGTQYLKYGRLGELTYQRRSVAVPSAGVYWFGTEWKYDTWNRVKSIIYPDGEVVNYKYNKAGNLYNVSSDKDGNHYKMIDNIGYDKFEQRVSLVNGNGTQTTYEYETNRRRLLKMYAKNSTRHFMQNTYQYDVVSNVMQVHNNAPVVTGLLGGGTNHAYGYDDLYRLTSASGNWRGINTQAQEERHRYTVSMSYDNMHNVTSKTQKHEWTDGPTNNNWAALEPTSYRLNYKYENAAHPHAPSRIIDEPNLVPSATCCNPDDPGVKFQNYEYDAKGNPTKILQETCSYTETKTSYLWDEENRLRFVDTNPSTLEVDGSAIYTYDAGGERIIKDVLYSSSLFRTRGEVSGNWPQTLQTSHDVMIYPNGLITMNVSSDGTGATTVPRYTKHYYAGSQRIVSKIGTSDNIGMFNCNWLIIPFGGITLPINPITVSNNTLQTATQSNLNIMQLKNITPPPNYGQNAGYNGNCVNNYAGAKEEQMYWFHPDHLGSSSYITGADGEVTQNIEYFPSGEVFMENHNNKSNNSVYKFNGKELDAETGYYYYGARYYNPRVSLWLNVDPLADYNPFYNTEHYIDGEHNGGVYNSKNLSPYTYCYQNPVILIDPNGKQTLTELYYDAESWLGDLDTSKKFRRWWRRNMDNTGNTEAIMRITPGFSQMMSAGDFMNDKTDYFSGIDGLKSAKLGNGLMMNKPCGCFTSGTQVLTENGYKNIEDIKKGDLVWAYDDKAQDLKLKKVINTYALDFSQIFKLYIGNEIIEATHEHPFFVGGKWVKVDKLKVGDYVRLYDGSEIRINKIEFIKGGQFKVYNFEVDELHSYFVGESKVLVHNGSPCNLIFTKALKAGGKEITENLITYERARNLAFELIGDMSDFKKDKGRLQSSYGYNKVIGGVSKDGKVRWRIDYDPKKGAHINVEDYRIGKGDKALKYALQFQGGEKYVKKLIDNLNK